MMPTLSYIHRYIPAALPAEASAKAGPPLLLLHGTGGDEHDLIPLGQKLSPGSALLSPRGDVLEQGMPRFFRRFTEGVFDLADVAKRTQALADFIAAAATQYKFDPARLIAVGFSNGANIAASLLLLRPDSLAGAVLLRPMIVLEPKQLPKLAGKRVLISSGTADPVVPADHPARLAALFRSAGAIVTLHEHAAGHGLGPADWTVTRKFLTPD